ncbi:MAG: hypothetical protein AAGG38_14860 [Planctomycetota bacterium]
MTTSPHPHPATRPAPPPTPADRAEAAERRRWRTVFVDGSVLDAVTPSPERPPPPEPTLTVVARLNDEVAAVRKNVRDAAAAVIAWLSAVVGHEAREDLDGVLDRCLRPGPDIERVNYAALAAEIQQVVGVELSAKRVHTAITHLRAARKKKIDAARAQPPTEAPPLRDALGSLHDRLRDNFAWLTDAEPAGHEALRRDLGTQVLTAVRSAASRVIDRDYGEGIPATVDLATLEGRFLDFVRDTLRRGVGLPANAGVGTAEADLRRLLVTLSDHHATAEAEMKLVMHGSAVVGSLLGTDSLPGVMAQLNVLVAGRAMVDTDLYVAEMLRLAELAESLREDPATATYMNWVRRRPEDQRLPSPVRVASYCRSNAATRLFDRIYAGGIDADAPAAADASRPARTYWQLACDTHDAMLARDGGFTLTLTGELIRHVVAAQRDHDDASGRAYVAALGQDKALARLEALIRYENNDELVAVAKQWVFAAYPALRGQLICVR